MPATRSTRPGMTDDGAAWGERLLRRGPVAHRRRRCRAAEDARDAEFDLAERRGGDAAERDGALAHLAPERDIALVTRALALELLDRCQRLLADAADVGGVGRLDHFLEDRHSFLGLVAEPALEQFEQPRVAHRVHGKRVFRHAADVELVDAVAVLR